METPISKYIDHTLLKADAQANDIQKICVEAMEFGFFSVCVNSKFVSLCKSLLKTSDVKVVSVVGFPLGAMSTEAKSFETQSAIEAGADEIDMVISIGDLKANKDAEVIKDIESVVGAAKGRPVKVIIETSMLTESEKTRACQLSLDAGAHFVKTSTGFGGGGATVEDILLMKKIVGDRAEVKASGGIKNLDQARALIAAGATRLGTSSGISIIQGLEVKGGY